MLGAALTGAAVYHFMKPPRTRHPVTAVESGVLYRSGQLEPAELEEEIKRRGIRTVVNLGSESDWDGAVCEKTGANYKEILVGDVFTVAGVPAPGYEQGPAAPYDLQPLWDLLEDPQSRPVLIHCQGGVHRTGIITAIYRIKHQGWTAVDALAEIRHWDFNIDKEKFAGVVAYLQQLEKVNQGTAMAQQDGDAGRLK